MSKPILVIGDTCQDIFVYCNCDRLCPEAPVAVLDIQKEESNLGMAGNVYRNIEDLGTDSKLITNSNAHLVTKTRYVDIKTNHMFIRVDSKTHISRIENLNEIDFKEFSAVVVSDYDKGFLNEEDLSFISKKHPLTFLDSKKILGDWANDFTFIKINRKEYAASKLFLTPKLQEKIIETIGSEGCSFKGVVYPVRNVEIKNLSGAGDSFLAALVVRYLEANNISDALTFANKIATIVVQKAGVSTIK